MVPLGGVHGTIFESFLKDRAIRGWWLTPSLHPAPTHRSSTHFCLPRVLGGGPTEARETLDSPLVGFHGLPSGQGYLGDEYIPLSLVPLLDGIEARVNL